MNTAKGKFLTACLFVLFSGSIAALAWHIFPELWPARDAAISSEVVSRAGRYGKIAEVPLGKVEIRGYKQMGSTPGLVRLSPDGAHIAVGTEDGEVLMLTLQGERKWSRKIGLGKISALAFSRDNRRIFIGENSQQGAIVCVDASTGSEIWRRASVAELGVDIRQKTFPGIMSIQVDGIGNAYAVALRSIRYASGQTEYFSRIYKFDQMGNAMLYPLDHNLDIWVSWCDVDEAGKLLTFGTSDYTPGPQRKYTDNIYGFDAKTGKLMWSAPLSTIAPYDRTNMRFGPAISADGRFLGGVSADGRAFFLDSNGNLLWTRTLSAPQRIQGVFVNATGLHVRHIGEYAVFSTGNTYNRANWQLPTPVEHPQSNSVFAFDRNGSLIKRRKFGGMVEEMQVAENWLTVAVGRNTKTKDPGVHGLVVMNAPDLELVDSMPTDGPCVAAAVNSDHVVGMEAPLQLDNGEVIGAYRIHIWRKK